MKKSRFIEYILGQERYMYSYHPRLKVHHSLNVRIPNGWIDVTGLEKIKNFIRERHPDGTAKMILIGLGLDEMEE
jgi:hypothetical protein